MSILKKMRVDVTREKQSGNSYSIVLIKDVQNRTKLIEKSQIEPTQIET